MATVFFRTGNPALDAILSRKHPLEEQFPIGSHVNVTMDEGSLTAKIAQDWNIRPMVAKGIAQYLRETAAEVIGISDLQDTDGQTKPFVSIMDPEGYLYTIQPEYLTK